MAYLLILGIKTAYNIAFKNRFAYQNTICRPWFNSPNKAPFLAVSWDLLCPPVVAAWKDSGVGAKGGRRNRKKEKNKRKHKEKNTSRLLLSSCSDQRCVTDAPAAAVRTAVLMSTTTVAVYLRELQERRPPQPPHEWCIECGWRLSVIRVRVPLFGHDRSAALTRPAGSQRPRLSIQSTPAISSWYNYLFD